MIGGGSGEAAPDSSWATLGAFWGSWGNSVAANARNFSASATDRPRAHARSRGWASTLIAMFWPMQTKRAMIAPSAWRHPAIGRGVGLSLARRLPVAKPQTLEGSP